MWGWGVGWPAAGKGALGWHEGGGAQGGRRLALACTLLAPRWPHKRAYAPLPPTHTTHTRTQTHTYTRTGDEDPTVEVHVLHDFSVQDFHGAHLRAVATSYLRPEMAFDSLAALQKRIKADIGVARSQLDGEALRAVAGDASFERR